VGIVRSLFTRASLMLLPLTVSTSGAIAWSKRVPGPFGLDRPWIGVIGAVVGLLLGIGCVALVARRDSSFKRADEVVRALSVPVLAVIPVMISSVERKARRRRTLVRALISAFLMAGAAAVFAWWRLQS
jgi:hypothetical protein